MSICFAVTAQANVVNNYGAYKGNFTGQEVVFTSDGDLVTDPADLAQVGLQMYALAVISTINTTKSASSSGEVNYPPVFTSRNGGGTYFATLSGFSASKVGDVVQEGTRIVQDVFFTGGTLNWYYSEDDSLNDVLQWMRYDSTVGDYAHYGTVLGDILPDPFLVADIVSNDPEYTGKVTVERICTVTSCGRISPSTLTCKKGTNSDSPVRTATTTAARVSIWSSAASWFGAMADSIPMTATSAWPPPLRSQVLLFS